MRLDPVDTTLNAQAALAQVDSARARRAQRRGEPVGSVQRQAHRVRESLAEPEIPIWQLHDRYLLAPIRGGLVIVDQHAAHERILYEEARVHLFGEAGVSQSLLFPRVLGERRRNGIEARDRHPRALPLQDDHGGVE